MTTLYEALLIATVSSIAVSGSIMTGLWFLFRYGLNSAISDLAEILTGQLSSGPMKSAMSILGKESGKVRSEKAMADKIATQVLSSGNLGALKMIGKQIGVDLDAMIEEYGAVETLQGLQQLGGILGINIQDLLSGNLGNLIQGDSRGSTSKQNPYLVT